MKVPLLDLKIQYKSIKDEIKNALEPLLDSQCFILGSDVDKLEEEIASYSNTQYAVGVASGSDALLISLMALGIQRGDEVITTPFTFFATAGSISLLGAIPVFVDINPQTFNINPDLIEEKITEKTKAIIPVHLFGQCADMDPILAIAQKHNLKVIEDAAQSIGAHYKDRTAGSMGDTGCLSFFPSKNLGGFGDGGMVLTNNEELAHKIRILRVHGSVPKYHHSIIGLNSRLDTIQATVLRIKLKHLDTWTDLRKEHALLYNKSFKDTQIRAPFVQGCNSHVYNQYVIRVKRREQLMNCIKENGIGTAIYYPIPLHLQECYKHLGYKQGDFPESEQAAKEVLSLPIFPELSNQQQGHVIKAIKISMMSDYIDTLTGTS